MSLTQESLPYPADETDSFAAEHETPSQLIQESTSFSSEHNNWHSAQSTPQFAGSPVPSYLPQETIPFSAHHGVAFSSTDGSQYSTHQTTSYSAQPFASFSPYYNPPFRGQNDRATASAVDVNAIGKTVEEQLAHADLLMSFNQNMISGAKVKKPRRRRMPANPIEKKPRKPRAKRVSIFDNSFAGLDKSQRISASIEAVIRHAMTDTELKDRIEPHQNSYDSGYDHNPETDNLKQAEGDTPGSFNTMMTHICNSYCENLELSGAQPSLQCDESLQYDESLSIDESFDQADKEAPSQSSYTSPPKQHGGALQTLCDAARIFRGPPADSKPVKRTRRTYRRRNVVPEDDSSTSSHSETSFVEPVNTADFVVPSHTPQKAYSVPPNTPDNSVSVGSSSDSYRVMDAGLVHPQSTYSTSASFTQQNPTACFSECCTTQPHYQQQQQQQQSAFQPMASPYGLSPFANVNPFIPPAANSLGYMNNMSRLAAGPFGAYNPMMLPSPQGPFGMPTQFSAAQRQFLDALPPVVSAHVREMFVSVWVELQRGMTYGQILQNLMIRNPTMSSIVAQLFSYASHVITLGLQPAPMSPMQQMAQLAPAAVAQSTDAQPYETQYS